MGETLTNMIYTFCNTHTWFCGRGDTIDNGNNQSPLKCDY